MYEGTAEFRGIGLAETIIVGADSNIEHGFDGSLLMFQIYDGSLSPREVECVFEEGKRLVQSGRTAQSVSSECRGPISTGCTSTVGKNGLKLGTLGTKDNNMVDDGSCQLDENVPGGERGNIQITDVWQSIVLQGAYTQPVVLCTILTRRSTAQAVLRTQNLQIDRSGTW
jgi:hypothetical protein